VLAGAWNIREPRGPDLINKAALTVIGDRAALRRSPRGERRSNKIVDKS
jgi:hypothetical protein